MKPPVEEEINIEKVLIRADVVWYSDMMDGFRIVKSKNVKEPLTEKEQKCLERMWRDQGFEGDVIFYVGEEKLNERYLQAINPSF